MPYSPELTFFADGVDITEYVTNFRFSFGQNAYSNPQGRNRILPTGQLVLNNRSGYWTEDRLEVVSSIVARADAHYMCDALVKDFLLDAPSRSVRITLQSKNAPIYENRITFNAAGSNFSEDDVLADAGCDDNEPKRRGAACSSIEGMGSTGLYRSSLTTSVIWADAYLVEDARGNFSAIVPATEGRAADPAYLAW